MQIAGTSTAASPFCRRASRSSACGANTEGAEASLLARMGGLLTCRLSQRMVRPGRATRGRSRHSDRAAVPPAQRVAGRPARPHRWSVAAPFTRTWLRPRERSGLAGNTIRPHCWSRHLHSHPGPVMTQTTNRFFDEIARLMNDAAGAASGVRREVETVIRNQAERILRDLDLVKREEFEAVKEMARLAREENEALKARVAALEARLGPGGTP